MSRLSITADNTKRSLDISVIFFTSFYLFLGSDVLADFRIQLTEPKILRKEREITTKSQHKLNVPFDIRIESISPFNIPLDGFNYSHAGLKLYLERNSVSLLIGSFYGPTSIFSLLSMFSYCINVDSVIKNLIWKKLVQHSCHWNFNSSHYVQISQFYWHFEILNRKTGY